jgi:hypothetical protein
VCVLFAAGSRVQVGSGGSLPVLTAGNGVCGGTQCRICGTQRRALLQGISDNLKREPVVVAGRTRG